MHKQYVLIFALIAHYSFGAEPSTTQITSQQCPSIEPTLGGMPPEIKENIISQLPDEEQLFARLTLQQVSKEMHQQLLKVKNGSVEDFDAFLKKTAKQLGPISTNYLYFLLYGNPVASKR